MWRVVRFGHFAGSTASHRDAPRQEDSFVTLCRPRIGPPDVRRDAVAPGAGASPRRHGASYELDGWGRATRIVMNPNRPGPPRGPWRAPTPGGLGAGQEGALRDGARPVGQKIGPTPLALPRWGARPTALARISTCDRFHWRGRKKPAN